MAAWRGVRGVRPYLYPLGRKLHDDLALNLAREIRGCRRRAPAGAAAARGRCRHPCDGAHYCAQLAGVLRARATFWDVPIDKDFKGDEGDGPDSLGCKGPAAPLE